MNAFPKTALITGGATRIGQSLCLGLADHGFDIALHYNTSQQAAKLLITEIQKKGRKAMGFQADLTHSEAMNALLPEVTNHMGPVGLLINNASLFHDDHIAHFNEDIWNNHFDIHLKAPHILASHFVAQHLDRGQEQGREQGLEQNIEQGLIVNIIDQRVLKPSPRFMSYTLSKSALWTATRTMAQALAPAIRVNAIGPGPTLPSPRQSQKDFDQQIETLLLKRGPQLQEILNTVLYFLNTPSITGQMIALDGGQHLAWQTPDQLIAE